MYEIVIGGWSNSKSVIRNGMQGTSYIEKSGEALDYNSAKKFVISY